MGAPLVATFLPSGWPDLCRMMDALGLEDTRLYRWEEQFTEAGERRRAAHVVAEDPHTPLEHVAARVIAHARLHRFLATPPTTESTAAAAPVPAAAEDPQAIAVLVHEDDRALTIATRPLPSRLLVALVEPRAWGGGMRVVPSPPPCEWATDPTRLPPVAALLGIVSRVARVRVAFVDRFAEEDVPGERFHPPTVRARFRGTFALEAVCAVLADAGWEEDGDAWLKESREVREEVRLREGEIELASVPGELAGVPIAPLARSTRAL